MSQLPDTLIIGLALVTFLGGVGLLAAQALRSRRRGGSRDGRVEL